MRRLSWFNCQLSSARWYWIITSHHITVVWHLSTTKGKNSRPECDCASVFSP